MQSDPHDRTSEHWKCVQFNNLLLQSYWKSSISGTEPYRALKIKMPKEKFVKTNI